MEWGPTTRVSPAGAVKELFDERGIFVGGIVLRPGSNEHFLVNAKGTRILTFTAHRPLESFLEHVYLCRRFPSKQLPTTED